MFILFVLLLSACLSCTQSLNPPTQATQPPTAVPWPEADRLFREDAHWLGGDGAYSIDLGRGRVLWLFGDSLIGPGGSRDRRRATLVRNSLAIQSGYDPTTAAISFYWGKGKAAPDDFFPGEADMWYWPGSGLRIGDRLLLFLMKIRRHPKTIFEVSGWGAVLVKNPDEDPGHWDITFLHTPVTLFNVAIGCGAVLRRGDYVYAFSAAPSQDHPVYLVRWPASDAGRGNLDSTEWWTGNENGWRPQADLKAAPPPLFSQGQMEFSVHFDSEKAYFLQIQTGGFWDPRLVFRRSDSLTGPWAGPFQLNLPEADSRPGRTLYAGKAHPELTCNGLAATYVVNSYNYEDLYRDGTMYYPVFLRLEGL